MNCKQTADLLSVQFHRFVVISNIEGVGRYEIIAFENLHVVHFEFGPKSVGLGATRYDSICN